MRQLVVIIALLSLVACAPATVTVAPPQLSENLFHSAELGFSMRVPQGWLAEEGETPGIITFLDSRVKPASDSLPALPVSVAVMSGTRAQFELPKGEITSPAVLNVLLRQLGVGMKLEAAAPVPAVVAGKPAARLEVGGILNMGTELVGRVVAVDLGERVWAAFALSPKSEWQAFEPFFEQMVSSVGFGK